MSDGQPAGSGYRVIIGWITLVALAVLMVVCYVLLYTRGNRQPLKTHSPIILASLTLQLYLGCVWIQFREIGWFSLSCRAQMYIASFEAIVFSVPVLGYAYRLVLLHDYEQYKLTAARSVRDAQLFETQSKLAALSANAGLKSPKVWAVVGALCLGPVLYLPLIDHYTTTTTTTDGEGGWDATECVYGISDFLLSYLVTYGWICVFASYVIWQLWAKKVPDDSFGIRANLMKLLPFSNTFIGGMDGVGRRASNSFDPHTVLTWLWLCCVAVWWCCVAVWWCCVAVWWCCGLL